MKPSTKASIGPIISTDNLNKEAIHTWLCFWIGVHSDFHTRQSKVFVLIALRLIPNETNYSRVPNKRPGTRIYFPKNASLYGPYLALYVYLKKKKKKFFFFFTFKCISLHILATQFLRNTTNSPDLVVNKSGFLYNLSLGRLLEGDPLKCCLLIQAAGTGSDCASSNFPYNL